MRTLNKLWGVCLMALLIVLVRPHAAKAQDGDEITFQTFYDELSPYGTWIDDPEYGDVWVPDVQEDFRPYGTDGHWVMTDEGNTWVSDFEWGWAPFHYGRWRFDDYYGWEWIPGYEWGPAWVNWRTGGGYYGWAPLGPGISLDLAFGGGYNAPDFYWNFAPYAYITSPYIYRYYVPRTRVVSIIHNTTVINNVYRNGGRRYIAGPRRDDIERYTHKRVSVYNINNSSRPGGVHIQNNTVNIYRPRVGRAATARPTRVIDARAYRDAHPDQRIASGQGNAHINRQNTQRLANFARTATPDNKIIRVNERLGRPNVPRTDRQPTPVNRPGQPVMNDQQRQQNDQRQQQQRQQEQQRPPVTNDQRQQMEQQREQQRQQQRQQDDQQRRQRPPQDQQAQQQQQAARQQQMEQARQQQQQQAQQQARQQQDAQRRQQMEQQRQQREQQHQQDDQQRRQRPPQDQQQMEQQRQARQQQQQAQQQARQQQMEQQRQQQQQAQQQARQQQMEQQRQQQQQAQQQMEQQRQQQQQARQQQEQQRRQQQEQQRQQDDQQRRQRPPR